MTSTTSYSPRLAARFAALKAAGRLGLVTFMTAGDPDLATCQELLLGLPAAGADIIELGMPFSDPMADGPAIQAANLRALKAGMDLERVLALAGAFRLQNQTTPLVLMGYYNPIFHYGPERFANAAARAGVDGVIVVDLPPEEDEELRPLLAARQIDFIRMVTPTTDVARLAKITAHASGFLYYVTLTGVTGVASAAADAVRARLAELRRQTNLPLVAGFGIRTAAQVQALAGAADAVVVGSAIVEQIAKLPAEKPDSVLALVRSLTDGLSSHRAA